MKSSPSNSLATDKFGAKVIKSLERVRFPSTKAEVYPDPGEKVEGVRYRTPFATSPTFVTLVHFVKALLGPTVLAMPGGFKHGGLAFSPPAYVLLVLLIVYNSRRLVLSAEYLSRKEGYAVRTYDEVAFVAFNRCSEWTKNYAGCLKNTINILFFVTYMDACIIFMIFVGRNLEFLLESYCSGYALDVRQFIFLQVSLFMLMSSFRDLKHLFVFSAISSVLMVIAIFTILLVVFLRDPEGMSGGVRMVGSVTSLIRFACVVLFCFSGISMSLTLKSSMKSPEDFFSGPSIFYFTVVLAGACLVIFGFFGYWKYGADTHASVLLNIEPTNTLLVVLKVITILSVFLTTPFAFYVTFNVLWQNFFKKCFPPTNIIFAEYLTRYFLISLCFMISVAFPDLGWMIVMKGGLFHSNLEITLPAILDYVTFYPEKGSGRGYVRLWKMIFICLLGVIFFFGGLVVSLIDFYD